MTTAAPPAPAPPSLARLADELAVRGLLERYTDAVNRRDWAAVRACWADDGVWDLHAPVNQTQEGIEAIMTEVQRAVGTMEFFFQMAHAVVVDLDPADPDRATARVSLHEIGRAAPGQQPLPGADGMSIHAMYHDQVVRRGGRWQFLRRTYDVADADLHAPAGQTITRLS